MTTQQFCLRWNNHQPNFVASFSNLLNNESLVDVTLAAEGKHIQAHRIVLSACSTYFQTLLSMNACQHPIVILKDVRYKDLRTIVEYMYYGEVNVSEDQLPIILKTAEMLQIKGLTEMPEEKIASNSRSLTVSSETRSLSPAVIRRKRFRKSSTNSGSGSLEHLQGNSEESIEGVIVTSPSPLSQKIETGDSFTSPLNSPPDPSTESESKDLSSKGSLEEDHCSLSQQPSTESNDSRKSGKEDSRPASSSSQSSPQNTPSSAGSRRGRLLMRQPRIKKESDGDKEELALERLSSDTCPPSGTSSPSGNLLTVPQPSFLIKQHSHPLLFPSCSASSSSSVQVHVMSPSDSSTRSSKSFDELRRTMSTPQYSTIKTEVLQEGGSRSVHCPVLRSGPALGCNFCWNTIDGHGRILRRKTKYHCPECRTNLCIVPCFQDYHEKCRLEENKPATTITRVQSPVSLNSGSVPTIVKTRSV